MKLATKYYIELGENSEGYRDYKEMPNRETALRSAKSLSYSNGWSRAFEVAGDFKEEEFVTLAEYANGEIVKNGSYMSRRVFIVLSTWVDTEAKPDPWPRTEVIGVFSGFDAAQDAMMKKRDTVARLFGEDYGKDSVKILGHSGAALVSCSSESCELRIEEQTVFDKYESAKEY